MSTEKVLPITIEFGGGAESLFDKKKKYEVNLPGDKWTLKRLLYWIRDNLLKERLELFMQNDTVRPGILVLVNDTDWELLPLDGCGSRDGPSLISHITDRRIEKSLINAKKMNDNSKKNQGDYVLRPRDTVLFISTLHGG